LIKSNDKLKFGRADDLRFGPVGTGNALDEDNSEAGRFWPENVQVIFVLFSTVASRSPTPIKAPSLEIMKLYC